MVDKNTQLISDWVHTYEKKVENGLFENMTKFRQAEWECLYELAVNQLERGE